MGKLGLRMVHFGKRLRGCDMSLFVPAEAYVMSPCGNRLTFSEREHRWILTSDGSIIETERPAS